MSERARALAARFERANEELLAVVDELSDAQWRASCPDEGRTVAAVARHCAVAYPFQMRAFQSIADDQPAAPIRWETIHRLNERDAARHAACPKAEVVELAQRNAAPVAAAVRALSDEQLARAGAYVGDRGPEGTRLTVDQWIEQVLIGHVEAHLKNIRAT